MYALELGLGIELTLMAIYRPLGRFFTASFPFFHCLWRFACRVKTCLGGDDCGEEKNVKLFFVTDANVTRTIDSCIQTAD